MTPAQYERRVRALEAEGLTTSDAQGVADAELLNARDTVDWLDQDTDPPDQYDWPDDHKLDDPRRGQAKWINKESGR